MTHKKLPLILGISTIVNILIFDQLSKWWVITQTYKGEGHSENIITWLFSTAPRFNIESIKITEFFNMVMVWNKGVSFGLFNQPDSPFATLLSTVSLLIAVGFFGWLLTLKRIFPSLGIGMIIGGAVSNVWDRLRFGAVADFFDLHIADNHWPAFNVADAAIVIGVGILMIDTLFFEPKEQTKN